MSISSKYAKSNAAYNENNETKKARNNLVAVESVAPSYQNSYASQLKDIYGKIKNGADFSYDPQNDTAYRRFADEYNALSSLAIASNHQQAQNLTGGYGSSYAPEVSKQGLASLKSGVTAAQPLFAEQAQEAYKANNDMLNNTYEAAANARSDELSQYEKAVDAYNTRYKLAQEQYSDARDFDYNKYSDNRDFWAGQYDYKQNQSNTEKEFKQTELQNQRDYEFNSFDVYSKIAAEKCSKYSDDENNGGMKAYLNGLVKAGKITKYMADNLYNQYKYTAPKTSSSGGSGGSKKKVNDDSQSNPSDTGTDTPTIEYDDNIPQGIWMTVGQNRSEDGQLDAIEGLLAHGDITEAQANYMALHKGFAQPGEAIEWNYGNFRYDYKEKK